MQFWDKVFSDCAWHIKKAVDVRDVPTQFSPCHASHETTMMKVWVMTTTLLEFGAADEETKMEEVSDHFSQRNAAFFALRPFARTLSAFFRSPRWRRVLGHRGLLHDALQRVVIIHILTFNSPRLKQQQEYNLERLRFRRRGASTPLWGVESCSPRSRRPKPIPATPALCRQDTTLRREQLNSGTNACNKTYLKEIEEKRKEDIFS